jgi:hypothetical protein
MRIQIQLLKVNADEDLTLKINADPVPYPDPEAGFLKRYGL